MSNKRYETVLHLLKSYYGLDWAGNEEDAEEALITRLAEDGITCECHWGWVLLSKNNQVTSVNFPATLDNWDAAIDRLTKRYELFYSTGGHVGPFYGQNIARGAAVARLHGDLNERWISIRPYDINGVSGYGPEVERVLSNELEDRKREWQNKIASRWVEDELGE